MYTDSSELWNGVKFFLNQNDLYNLSTIKRFNESFANSALYRTIRITKHPVIRTDKCYFDCGCTYIGGYRSLKKTNIQNDMFLYDKLERLVESPHINLIKELYIETDVFSMRKEGMHILRRLLNKVIALGEIEILDIQDRELFEEYYPQICQLPKLKYMLVKDMQGLSCINSKPNLSMLSWAISSQIGTIDGVTKEVLANQISKLDLRIESGADLANVLHDFVNQNILFPNVIELKFNQAHCSDSPFKAQMEPTSYPLGHCFLLKFIIKMEIEFCCWNEDCSCTDKIFESIEEDLHSLKHLSLSKLTPIKKGSHYPEERWDYSVGRFLVNIPNVSQQLKGLTILHDPPLDGIADDTVEGNYRRRRTIYENVLPTLKSLEKLVIPNMLQAIAPYEIIACDLIWNGCVCPHCSIYLPLIDEYLMSHQYYSDSSKKFLDVIPSTFFGFVGHFLSSRFSNRSHWNLNLLENPPAMLYWDFHETDRIRHFNDYNCAFDELLFDALEVCVTHFFNSYMDHIIKWLPNLKVSMFSGIYYVIQDDTNTVTDLRERTYKIIYND